MSIHSVKMDQIYLLFVYITKHFFLKSKSYFILQAGSLTAPPASAPGPPRSPQSSAPVTPSSSSTTATPCSARRDSPATPQRPTLERATPARPPRTGPATSKNRGAPFPSNTKSSLFKLNCFECTLRDILQKVL